MDPLKSILNEINQRRDAILRALADGAAKDFAEYRELCGEVRGLSFSHMLITDLVRKIEEND